MRNTIARRLLTIIAIVIASVVLIIWLILVISNSMGELAYDLGEKSKVGQYNDKILKSYNDYYSLVKAYDITPELTEANFLNNYYVASFIEYDTCAESKLKKVESVVIGDTINITYKVFNKCGWCRPHIALHLIKIDKITKDKPITYEYLYQKEVNCGVVK